MNIINDNYYETFKDYAKMVNTIEKIEENTQWLPQIESRSLRIEAIEPIEVPEICDKTGISYDSVYDTAENTQLMMRYEKESYMVRDTALSTLFDTAKISGQALGRMSSYDLAEVLNRCLQTAKGKSLFLVRGEKVNACLSDNIYQVMPISELLSITERKLTEKFGNIKFVNGETNHVYTSATWELIDAQEQLLENYENAIYSHAHIHGHNFMPAVKFITSDIGVYAATLIPCFKMSNGACVQLNDGIKVHHKKGNKNNIVGIKAYEQEAEGIFAKFADLEKTLVAMSNTRIQHPTNALIGMCKKAGISKKYASLALEEIETYAAGQPLFMDDIYLSIAAITASAKSDGMNGRALLNMEENIAKILNYKWENFDIGGVVAW